MGLLDMLDPRRITVGFEAATKESALANLAEMFEGAPGVESVDEVVRVITDREAIGTTGTGRGLAIPHGRLWTLREPIAALAIAPKGIDFESIDGEPVYVLCCFLTAKAGGTAATAAHLNTIKEVARAFRDDTLTEALRRASSQGEVLSLLRERPA